MFAIYDSLVFSREHSRYTDIYNQQNCSFLVKRVMLLLCIQFIMLCTLYTGYIDCIPSTLVWISQTKKFCTQWTVDCDSPLKQERKLTSKLDLSSFMGFICFYLVLIAFMLPNVYIHVFSSPLYEAPGVKKLFNKFC